MAAMLMLAYNGANLVSLLDPALIGYSANVRMVSQKWHQLDTLQANKTDFDPEGLNLTSVMYQKPPPPPPPEIEPEIEEIAMEEAPEPVPVEVILPTLTGIIESKGVNEPTLYYALIDGKKLAELDHVSGFIVQKIDRSGVTLTREDRQWFVARPEVFFSIDRNARIHRGKSPATGVPAQVERQDEAETRAMETLKQAEKLGEL